MLNYLIDAANYGPQHTRYFRLSDDLIHDIKEIDAEIMKTDPSVLLLD